MHDALTVALIFLASAVGVVVLFRRLHMPPILGYLIVGAAVGPFALGLVADTEDKRYLAEFGVVFLMFSVGLEFSLPQLMAMRRTVFGFGGAQVLSVMAVGLLLSLVAGQTWQTGLVVGGVLAMSSTAIVSKTLTESGQINSAHGRQIMGVLLFQDLAVIPLLVLIPALSSTPESIAAQMLVALGKAAVVLLVVLYLGQKLMRPLFHLVAKQKSSELFVLLVLLVTLGMAWLTEHAGLSLALGAFLAGMLISETEYRYQVEDYIKPFRDVLLGLFFITIGMLLNVRAVLDNFLFVVLVLLSLLAIKFVLIFAIARVMKTDKPTSLRSAIALAPAGEFGFVLLALADRQQSFPPTVMQVVLAACLLSMMLTPLLLARMERIVLHMVESEWTQRAVQLHQLAVRSMNTQGHVIVCGYGRSGQALVQLLQHEKIPVIALDSDPERVRQAAAAGEAVVYGDAARREVLASAALGRANAVVVSFADTPKALAILSHVRQLRPELPVIVRTFDDSDVQQLKEAGAAEIVAEVVEGSLMLATQTMMLLGMPLDTVLRKLGEARQDRYQFMRGYFPGATDVDRPDHAQPRLHTFVLGPSASCIGKTLQVLDLTAVGVSITTIRRAGGSPVEPLPAECLQEGDVLVLMGLPGSIAKAEIRLMQG